MSVPFHEYADSIESLEREPAGGKVFKLTCIVYERVLSNVPSPCALPVSKQIGGLGGSLWRVSNAFLLELRDGQCEIMIRHGIEEAIPRAGQTSERLKVSL